MSAGVVTVTGRKASITKSRSGHYTATITELGTWTMPSSGQVYPYAERILHETKLELNEARALIRKHSEPTQADFLAALGPCGR